MGLGHAFLGCPCPAGGDGDKGLKEGAAGRPGCRGASGRAYRSLGGEEEHLAREPLWDTKPGGQPLCAQPGGSLAAGHGEGRGLAWPSSWVGCPLSTPIPWWADQWEMMEHQVPCWCHSPHPPPFAAPQTDSPWHKVGGGTPPQRGPSGSQRYFPIQGNICSCLSVQSSGQQTQGPEPHPPTLGREWGLGPSPEPRSLSDSHPPLPPPGTLGQVQPSPPLCPHLDA